MARKTSETITPPTRVPPQNIEAEQWVLGGILIENGALFRVLEVISGEEFYREAHRKIFAAMLGLYEKNEPQDIVTVSDFLRNRNELEDVGGMSYLATLADAVPTAANIVHYAKIIREKSILRSLIQKTSEISYRCYEKHDDVDNILDEAEQAIFEISQAKVKQSFYPIKHIIKDSFKKIEQLYERKELITGVPTGFDDINKLTAGFQPSDLIIIAGRPSMGKTSLALNIAQHAAIKANIPVAIFSLEMSNEQLAMRMLCAEATVDARSVRTGFLTEKDWQKLTQAASHLSTAPIFIDDTPAISILEMRAKARRLKSEHGLGLVIIDYLQLMRSRGPVERREQEISEISRSLKAMAKELHVPVVALSQLNRRVEERPNKRPQLSDLRESGAIEQDADVIMFIYRDKVYNKNSDDMTAEVIIGKQRNGPTGLAKLTFLEQYSCFKDQAPTDLVVQT
ncbi:MAG: replicative DNA helicase [Thermodesulfobacteriota bacterium]